MDYKYAMQKAEIDIYNRQQWMLKVRNLRQLKQALEPYRKCKRINLSHCKLMQAGFSGNLRSCSIQKADSYIEDRWKFTWHYSILQITGLKRDPYLKHEYDNENLTASELSGESIYQKIVARIEYLERPDQKVESLDEYAAIYGAIETLEKQHPNIRKALEFLVN